MGIRTPRPAAILIALLLVATGCGGPPNPIQAGVKEFPTDVLLGSTEGSPAPSSVAPAPIEEPAPILVRPLTDFPSDEPRPVPTPAPACPAADPLSSPANEAFSDPAGSPPTTATYAFRNEGRYSVKATTETAGVYAGSERSVRDVRRDGIAYEFTVSDTLGSATRYRVVPRTGSAVPQAEDPGLYIVSISSQTPEKVDTFTPVQPMRLAGFPLSNGDRVQSTGASPTGSTVMRFDSTIGRLHPDEPGRRDPKGRVDACGSLLDIWWIDVAGTIRGANKNLTFTTLFAFGPQYGGLMLEERWKVSGTDAGATVSSERRSVISREPAVPR
ncbi:MAG TPA: hypothetical protein VM840_00975 [Actinomycetota bacterium]|nr:hypothetical protein [Actinomycetota bacterium]